MSFPDALKQHRRWMCWKIVPQPDGKPDKEPFNPVTGAHANVADPDTWVDYWTAAQAVEAGEYGSVGFVLGGEAGLCVVDFDNVKESTSDPWPEWVTRELDELDSYTEVSASGRGLHVLVWGALPGPNMNRQKCHVELWGSNKMFALSGNVLEGRSTIQTRDLSVLYSRIANGKIGPNYKPPIIAERWDSEKFRAVCNDEWEKHGLDSRSAAVQSALVTLCMKYANDEQVRTEFEKTALCAAWEEKGKWSRLGEREIARAREFAAQHTPITENKLELKFSKPSVRLGKGQYVMLPKDSKFDGWFRRGSVSLVGGPSGAGKTTLMFDLLQAQSAGETYLGHEGAGLRFLVLFADRTREEMDDTLERMQLPADFPAMPLRISWGNAAAAAILDAIEKADCPPAVFIEGGDTLVEDASKIQCVSGFLSLLQEMAHHYGTAIILSVGAPKSTPQGNHKLVRVRIFGSQIWPRMAGTVASLTIPGDGTDDQRELVIQHRNAKTEKFPLVFSPQGRLVLDTVPRLDEATSKDMQRIKTIEEFNGGWFGRAEFQELSGLGKTQAHQWLEQQAEKQVLKRRKSGKGWEYRMRTPLEAVSSEGVNL